MGGAFTILFVCTTCFLSCFLPAFLALLLLPPFFFSSAHLLHIFCTSSAHHSFEGRGSPGSKICILCLQHALLTPSPGGYLICIAEQRSPFSYTVSQPLTLVSPSHLHSSAQHLTTSHRHHLVPDANDPSINSLDLPCRIRSAHLEDSPRSPSPGLPPWSTILRMPLLIYL